MAADDTGDRQDQKELRSVTLILKVIGKSLLFVFAPFKTLTLQYSRNECLFCLYFAKILLCATLI